jgi:hypothetical protein
LQLPVEEQTVTVDEPEVFPIKTRVLPLMLADKTVELELVEILKVAAWSQVGQFYS